MKSLRISFLGKTLIAALLLLSVTGVAQAQFTNVRVSGPGDHQPEEVTIAVDHSTPTNLAAAANINYYFNSTNGGQTWTEGQITSTFGVWGDPMMTYDEQGRLYFVHLSGLPNQSNWLDRIVVQRSTNNGMTWDDSIATAPNSPAEQDKAWLAVDETGSSDQGNLYMSWTQFDHYGTHVPTDSSHIFFSRSTNRGGSWSVPQRLDTYGGNCVDSSNTVEGATPAVGPNGEVYISWAGPQGISFTRSTDGGVSFSPERTISRFPGVGWTFNVPGIFRANGMPLTLCDVSNGPHRGTIYIQWSDQGSGADNTEIYFIHSNDQGLTWSAPVRVANDAGRHQHFFPASTIDDKTGDIYTVFYDRRDHAGDTTDVYLGRSTDGGRSFSNTRLSEAAFVPNDSVFFGDYIHIAAYQGHIYPIWMRMDDKQLSVWTALVTEPYAAVANASQPAVPSFDVGYPDGFSGTVTLRFALPSPEQITIELYNSEGVLIRMLDRARYATGSYQLSWDGKDLAGEITPSGVYFARLSATSGSFQPLLQKIIRTR